MTSKSNLTEGTMSFYDDHGDEYSRATVNLDLHALYEPFLREIPKGGHILDAGCGSGRDTKAFLRMGYRVTAIDASHLMAQLATTFTGQRCEALSFEEMTFKNQFDGIWACASVLHVPQADIKSVMMRFITALKPGGTMYISLKEGGGERIAEDGRFFSYYTLNSAKKLFSQFASLAVVKSWKTAEVRSLHHTGEWLNFLLRKSIGNSLPPRGQRA